jgi:AmmeMemoRadiSam system protein A
MAPSSYINITDAEQSRLLEIAWQSIRLGLTGESSLQLDNQQLTGNLASTFGTFVTLEQQGELRGCMGSLQTTIALAQSVSNSAFNAAFRDPRFPTLNASETDNTTLELSVLSELVPLNIENCAELLDLLEPGKDGLLLQDGRYRSTFLPKVWSKISQPEAFLKQLLRKAGLAPDHWSATIRFHRYHTVSFTGPEG